MSGDVSIRIDVETPNGAKQSFQIDGPADAALEAMRLWYGAPVQRAAPTPPISAPISVAPAVQEQTPIAQPEQTRVATTRPTNRQARRAFDESIILKSLGDGHPHPRSVIVNSASAHMPAFSARHAVERLERDRRIERVGSRQYQLAMPASSHPIEHLPPLVDHEAEEDDEDAA